MSQQRILFADVVPYDVPTSLDALRGPADGQLTLPLHLWWAPEPTLDLADRAELLAAYRAIVRDGRSIDQEALLDRDPLVAVWIDLRLPSRCRARRQDALSELAASAAAKRITNASP